MRDKDRCRHFNGIQHETCKAGINYKELAKHEELGAFGWVCRLPCTEQKTDAICCDRRELYTAEELQQQEEQRTKTIAEVLSVIKAINEKGGSSGSVECPRCNGQINFTVASYNGHIHASCLTPNCIRFLQ